MLLIGLKLTLHYVIHKINNAIVSLLFVIFLLIRFQKLSCFNSGNCDSISYMICYHSFSVRNLVLNNSFDCEYIY